MEQRFPKIFVHKASENKPELCPSICTLFFDKTQPHKPLNCSNTVPCFLTATVSWLSALIMQELWLGKFFLPRQPPSCMQLLGYYSKIPSPRAWGCSLTDTTVHESLYPEWGILLYTESIKLDEVIQRCEVCNARASGYKHVGKLLPSSVFWFFFLN